MQGLTFFLAYSIFSAVLGMLQFGYNTGVINAPEQVNSLLAFKERIQDVSTGFSRPRFFSGSGSDFFSWVRIRIHEKNVQNLYVQEEFVFFFIFSALNTFLFGQVPPKPNKKHYLDPISFVNWRILIRVFKSLDTDRRKNPDPSESETLLGRGGVTLQALYVVHISSLSQTFDLHSVSTQNLKIIVAENNALRGGSGFKKGPAAGIHMVF